MEDRWVREAVSADLAAINAIYNHYVIHSTTTYDVEPVTQEERQAWFAEHDASHPVLVAEDAGRVVGWGSLSTFRNRFGYRHTVEDSVFVRHDLLGRRVGTRILVALIDRAKVVGHHTMIGGIDADQRVSIILHERHGFREVARLREAGRKFDRWLDVVFMQRMLSPD
jgi:L-amino acid N-acyltransferase YncA